MISKNLAQRLMTGLPLAAIAVWYIFAANEWVFAAITILIGLIGYWEYVGALVHKKVPVKPIVLYLSQILVICSLGLSLANQQRISLWVLLGAFAIVLIVSLQSQAREKKLIFWYLFPILWIQGPLVLLFFLRFHLVPDRGSELIFFILLIAACNDIAAYFGGRRFGKHRLASKISPNKTVEGHLFGILGGLVPGLIMTTIWLYDIVPIWKAVPIIIILTIAAQAGDLLESKFKRFCEVKDSSGLIPGHGGLLDRIDAYLLALPVFVGLLYTFSIIPS